MKITALLLLAVCVVLLDSSSQVDGKIPPEKAASARWPFDPCRNKKCRTGYYCVRREWRGVCVPRPRARFCWLPMDTGDCNHRIPSYFYNKYTGRCQFFMYGGCGGNRNRFSSWSQCRNRCIRSWRPIPVVGLKSQPLPAKMYNTDPDS